MGSRWPALGPAEAMLLLDPAANPRDAMKVALTSLLMKGILRVGEVEKPRWFGPRKHRTLRQVGSAGEATPSEAAALSALRASRGERPMDEAVAALASEFGGGFVKFRDEHVLRDLARRGLLERYLERYLLLFARVRYRRTSAGRAERDRILGLMERARRLPPFVAENAAEALAVAAGLGTAILLVEELRPHLAELRALLRPSASDAGGGGGGDGGSAGGSDGGIPDWDLGAFDGSLESFDSSFDAASSDGGGDGGGGK